MDSLTNWIKLFLPAATSDAIAAVSVFTAIISLGVAVWALFFSYRAVGEAKRANRIAVHDHQMRVYEAFQALYRHITASDHLNGLEADEFAEQANLSAMYFPSDLAAAIKSFQSICKHAETSLRCWEQSQARSNNLLQPSGPWIPNLDEERQKAQRQALHDMEYFQDWLQRARTQGEQVQLRLRAELSLVG